MDQNEFLLFGSSRENETSNSSIWIMKMDTLLNILWERKYLTEQKFVSRISYSTNDSGNIAMGTTLYTDTPVSKFSIFFLEITPEGDSVKSRHEATGNPVDAMIYSILSNNEGYYAFVDGFSSYMPIPITSPAQRLDLDADFNIKSVHTLPMGIDLYMTAGKLNEQTYVLTGSKYMSGHYTEIGIQKTDTSNTIISSNHSGVPGEFPDDPAWFKSMVFNSENNIYTGGTGYGFQGITKCNLNYPNVFVLSNFDSLLNCRWTKYYGNDTACYSLMAMDATSDGGCIMAGTILAPASPENQTDIIIIKVDSLGLITSTNKPGTRPMQALVYPNPGNDYLMLQTGPQNTGAVFSLMNIQGQKLFEHIVDEATKQISTQLLLPGAYIWTLSRGNTLIETGKWIKE